MKQAAVKISENNNKFCEEISDIGKKHYEDALNIAHTKIKEEIAEYEESIQNTVAKSVISILEERGIKGVHNKGKKDETIDEQANRVIKDFIDLSPEEKRKMKEMADSDPNMKMTKERLLSLIDRVKNHPPDSRMKKMVDNLVNGPIGKELLGIDPKDDSIAEVKATVQQNKSWEEAVEVIRKQLLDPNLKRDSPITISINSSSEKELEIRIDASKYSPDHFDKKKEEEPPIKLTGLNIDKDGNITPSE